MLTVSTFYHFANLPDARERQLPLKERMMTLGVRGTIILAPEGVNATISGEEAAVDAVLAQLRSWPGFETLADKRSQAETHPFGRSKVKIKREVIGMGAPIDMRAGTGTYVKPRDWNALISAPDVTVIDTRNDYEVSLGSFKGALNPATRRFRDMVPFTRRQLDPATHKKVAMFCTGGIRCEKYSAYLKQQGFEEVYHLEGGILKYLEEVPESESRFEGSCYVFDDRIALEHGLERPTSIGACPACGHPLTQADMNHPEYVATERCGHCTQHKTPKGVEPVSYWNARYGS